jgi:hypothetical protein
MFLLFFIQFTSLIADADLVWNKQTVDDTGDAGYYNSIALDHLDNPHISYYDRNNSDLKYAYWTGSNWLIQTVDSNGGIDVSMVLDSSDNPHISYRDRDYHYKYAHWTGDDWQITTIETGGAGKTSIVLDSSEKPHICFIVDLIALKYTYWTGSTWQTEIVDNSSNIYKGCSIVLDSSDNPHISYGYGENRILKHAYWTGSQWKFETVDNTAFSISDTSIKFDSLNNPHIAYHDGYHFKLKYASFDGSSWSFETVDNYRGEGVSLVIDDLDLPHISFNGFIPGNDIYLKYAYYNGNAWGVRLIDAADLEGDTSIALFIHSNRSSISYYSSSHTLKYAFQTEATVSPPTLSSPINGASISDSTPHFDWSSVTGADSYEIEVDDSSGFTSPVIDTSVISSEYTPTTALANGTYYWHVRTVDNSVYSSWTATWSFILTTSGLSPPTLITPINNEMISDSTPYFNWSSVTGADFYMIQVDDSSNFTSAVVNWETTSPGYIPATALSDGTYYWRVRTLDNGVGGSWTAPWKFSLHTFITVISPNGGEIWQMGGGNKIIVWDPPKDISDVKIDLYRGGSFVEAIIKMTSNDGNYSWGIPYTLQSGGNYKIRISQYSDNSLYDESDNSFSIIPPIITLISPNGNENWQIGSSQTISWTITAGIAYSVNLELYKNGSFYSTIASNLWNEGNYTWEIPQSLTPGTNYKLKIISKYDITAQDESDDFFSIIPTRIEITQPSSYERNWNAGSSYNIKWNPPGIGNSVNLYLYDAQQNQIDVIAQNIPNTGSYQWKIPTDQYTDGNYQIKIISTTNPSLYGWSEGIAIENGILGIISPPTLMLIILIVIIVIIITLYILGKRKRIVKREKEQKDKPVKPIQASICPHCNESVETDWQACPNCGKDLPK